MRINTSKSKNHEFIYIIRDIYNSGSRTTKIYQKLGKIEDLCSEKTCPEMKSLLGQRIMLRN
ncbi:hypothetical protein B5E91_12640 [Thomasclavelia spiroformis]|uniref:Uncharacterized protein n=1 Tax=Thomasclavelia spiroformis TaxID=29348 RepID=A0A1Y4Q1T5_9FIRM|nr:hypothetical protein B5E98_11155 [Thomasclavelia spiroformis]OUQ03490.1 hypothetical protein B5E91_12640 [Thomasclavelia spiroformis]